MPQIAEWLKNVSMFEYVQRFATMNRKYYVGIFSLSLATLLLELAITRVLAVATWYHFAFLVISMALLGFGTSGIVLTLWTWLRERASIDRALAAMSIAFSVAVLVSYNLMQRIPFDPFQLRSDPRQLFFMPLYFALIAAPFFCSGLAIGLLLFRGGDHANRLYAADLLGAGIGCAAIAVIMPAFGGSGSIAVAAAIGFLAAAIFGFAQARGLAATGLVLAVITGSFAVEADQLMPIAVISKHHPLRPRDREPLYTAWNTFSRVDVYDLPAAPEKGWPDAGFSIIVDGASIGTGIADLSGGARNYLTHPDYRPTGIAYVGKMYAKVLILGSGSGREVLEALDFEAQSITAVEINPIINDIVTRQMRVRWGGLFEQPEVKLITEEGRSFLRRSKEKYDVIISIQTMTDAAITSGAMALSESYMFTHEAFADYLDHLTPDGVMLVTRPRNQIAKLFATAREVFEERGLGNPLTHLLAFNGPLSPFGHQLFNEGLMFKKSSWTVDEVKMVMIRLGVGHPDRWYGQPPQIYYSPPGILEPSAAESGELAILAEVLVAPNLNEFYAAHREEFRPATDDRPFFNQLIQWTALRLGDFKSVFAAGSFGTPSRQPVAEVMLIVMLIQSGVVASVLIMLPLGRLARHGLEISQPWTFLVYFAGLGLGFIMIEIVLIQRFLLFLGEPVYTFAVVLAVLLGFTGIGSSVVHRFRDARLSLLWIIPLILVVLLLTAFGSPWILTSALSLTLPWRIAMVVAMLAPLGLVLGMPFPTGLRIIAVEAPTFVPWAWGVNGFFTVVGSIAASIMGMAFGFKAVLAMSGACYLTSLFSMILTLRTDDR
jgi:hypothetical protein